MAWLFGKKKEQKKSPPDFTEEELNSDQGEGFVHVPSWPFSIPSTATHDTTPYPSGNLYPHVPSASEFDQVTSTNLSKDSTQGDGPHYLSGVPFQLSSKLNSRDFEIDNLRISEILSFIERIENENYDYSFSLEEGIVAEMNSRNNK